MDTFDWNHTAVQRLIIDAEETLSTLDYAVGEPDCNVRMRALRNGRRDYKEIVIRRRSFMLRPGELLALEGLLETMKERLRFLRERIARI